MVTGTRPWLRQARSGEIAGEATAEGPLTLVGLMGVLLQSAIVFTVAIPNFLGLTGSVVQHGAQSRLTKALTAATNLYKDDDRSFNGLTPAKLSSSARKFAWTTGGCGISPRNRISFYVTNADAAGDGQVLLLAGNSANNTCWYIAEVEVQPALETITGSGLGQLNISAAGAWYAKSRPGGSSCAATDPLDQGSGGRLGSTRPGPG